MSFLPESFASRFFVFVFLAMLLVVRMSVIQNHERWRRLGIQFETSAGWLTLNATAVVQHSSLDNSGGTAAKRLY